MVKYEDDCVGCPPEMGCAGKFCKYQKVPHYYCDVCGECVKKEYGYDESVIGGE